MKALLAGGWALALAGAMTGRAAETLRLPLQAGTPARLVLDSPLDDANFQDPIGYNERGRATRHFNTRITLTNTGTGPLTGRLLVINGRDWSTPEAVRAALHLPAEPRAFVPRIFAFWRSHIAHADSATEAAKNPHALLHHWGYALCGDNAAALARLLQGCGVPARKVALNGHVANEYFYDGGWHVFDGDQNVCHLRLDNRTPASAEEIRADPLLARRTKVFGPAAPMNVDVAAFNTSLFEFVAPPESKPLRPGRAAPPPPVETLLPGEKLIFHRTRAPEQPAGKTPPAAWAGVRESLGMLELTLNCAARRTPAGEVTVRTAFPILEAVNHTTGERHTVAPGEPVFELTLRPRSAGDRISVFGQRARVALPVFGRGENTVVLHASPPGGEALVELEIERAAGLTAPAAALREVTAGADRPEFAVIAEPGVDRLWWQIGTEPDGEPLAPNFDQLAAPVERLAFDPLTATFFNPGQPYFIRLKARRDGVWGGWSPPLRFTVEKPAPPAPVRLTAAGGKLQLSWPDAGPGVEYLVFGSNRRDFLPELFAAGEIIAMRDQRVTESRPNRNLVATTTAPTVALTPAHRFYRLIARRGAALSVPGELLVTPPALTAGLPAPTILQTRWTKITDSAAPGGYRDAYETRETPLPQ